MWTREFWKATFERMIRSAAAAVLGTWTLADGVLDMVSFNPEKALAIAGGAAAYSLLFALSGNVVTGNGPAFNKDEHV